MKFFVAGMSYKTAPVEVREQLAVRPQGLKCFGCRLKIGGGLSEVVLLSTCNRVEIYGVTNQVNPNLHNLFRYLASREMDFAPYAYVREGDEAIKHLFSVASGLDSMVLGETEITGQVKLAYQTAQEGKLTGRVLNRLFQTALQVGKEVRTTTQVGRGATSVGSVAVELAEKIFDGSLAEKSIMIVGAGKMGEACLRHIAKRGAKSVMVSNRSPQRAQDLAAELGGRAIRMEDCLHAMVETDIVVSSTGSPTTVLHRRDLEPVMRERRGRPLFLIDIAVPRDIEPEVQMLENVYLYDIDDLEEIVQANLRLREQELARCSEIIAGRTSAAMAKIWPEQKISDEPRIQHQPRWVFGGSAACPG
jgi:glutamyl-tRNA reductase